MIQKKVGVELRSVIDRYEEKEMSITKQSGEYIAKNELEIIKFTEEREDLGTVNHVMMISPYKVTIRRTGSIRLMQSFEVGKKHSSVYHHPFGTMMIEIETKQLSYQP